MSPDAGGFVSALKHRTRAMCPSLCLRVDPIAAMCRPFSPPASPVTSTNTAATSQLVCRSRPHLFPDSFDRRSSPRVTLGNSYVLSRRPDEFAGALTLNVGKAASE